MAIDIYMKKGVIFGPVAYYYWAYNEKYLPELIVKEDVLDFDAFWEKEMATVLPWHFLVRDGFNLRTDKVLYEKEKVKKEISKLLEKQKAVFIRIFKGEACEVYTYVTL